MLISYLKIAWRTLLKNKLYSLINIFGLSLGISVFLLSYLYVIDELSYDKFHVNADRIFRFTNSEIVNDDIRYRVGTTYPAANLMADEFPEIVAISRFKHHDDYLGLPLFDVGDKRILVDKLTWTDDQIFDIFSFQFIEGDPKTCLRDLRSLVITESIAKTLFGNEQVLGKQLVMNLNRDNDPQALMEPYTMTITGVIKDLPENSHLQFKVLGNILFSPYEPWGKDNWYFASFPTYVLLNSPEAAESLSEKLPAFIQRNYDENIRDLLTQHLQPVSDLRLEPLPGDTKTNSNMQVLIVMMIIALLILGLACINFMSLSTARYTKRAKEVGLRKVIGAQKSQLVYQFLLESVVIANVALVFSVFIVLFMLPLFNQLVEKNLSLSLYSMEFIITLVALGITIGLIAGSYPALFLASFRPARVLKSNMAQRWTTIIRKGLIIIQLTVTMSLLIVIGTIYYQMSYLQNVELDIKPDDYIFLRSKEEVYSNYDKLEAFKLDLLKNNSILAASGTWSIPFGINAPVFYYPFLIEGMNPDERFHMHLFRVDHDFLKTMNLEIINGRNFSKEFPTDPTNAFILNEAAVKSAGWEMEHALGKDLEVFSGGGNSFKKGKVIGVVRDVNFLSFHKKLGPLAISMTNDGFYRYIAIKIKRNNLSETLSHIENTWSKYTPGWPMELFFMKDEWKKNYDKDEKIGENIKYLTIVGLLIACLGVFALSSFISAQKQKQIGIRKVFGASVDEILRLLSMEFLRLIIIAFVIALPIGYYFSNQWLEQFAYRISLQWWTFFAVMSFSVVIFLITISYHSIKAALANPVEVLKNE